MEPKTSVYPTANKGTRRAQRPKPQPARTCIQHRTRQDNKKTHTRRISGAVHKNGVPKRGRPRSNVEARRLLLANNGLRRSTDIGACAYGSRNWREQQPRKHGKSTAEIFGLRFRCLRHGDGRVQTRRCVPASMGVWSRGGQTSSEPRVALQGMVSAGDIQGSFPCCSVPTELSLGGPREALITHLVSFLFVGWSLVDTIRRKLGG